MCWRATAPGACCACNAAQDTGIAFKCALTSLWLKQERTSNDSFFFPRSLFYAAPPMVAVPTFLPPFYLAPPMVAVPTLRPAAPIPRSSTVFTIVRDEPPCVADHVRAFMNRPRNSLLKQ